MTEETTKDSLAAMAGCIGAATLITGIMLAAIFALTVLVAYMVKLFAYIVSH